MVNDTSAGARVTGEELATKGTKAFLAAEELYRRERVFILQPQRVVLDEQFARLRLDNRRLTKLVSGKQGPFEPSQIDKLALEQLRLLEEFKVEIGAAAQHHDYSNYRASG
jgi:ABC-type phosphate transport system auxiliary subunit